MIFLTALAKFINSAVASLASFSFRILSPIKSDVTSYPLSFHSWTDKSVSFIVSPPIYRFAAFFKTLNTTSLFNIKFFASSFKAAFFRLSAPSLNKFYSCFMTLEYFMGLYFLKTDLKSPNTSIYCSSLIALFWTNIFFWIPHSNSL